jgi:nicotinamide-nucleotide amidase
VPEPARIIAEVAERLLADGRRLVTAESCTGGWVAKACTDLPGSSRWYRGGVVVYSDELKFGLLGVRPQMLARDGAVSEAVVRAMACGALERLGGDESVAVSGIAGPDGGSVDKPVGTVWFGWAYQTEIGIEVRAERVQFEGDRDAVRRAAVGRALAGLLERQA